MVGEKIGLVLIYQGRLPIWLDSFLVSCAHNPTIDWLIFIDDRPPDYRPSNVRFIQKNLSELKELITEKAQEPTIQNPIKFCDFKVCYGHIFEDYLTQYDYWGHCDMDIIFGDLNRFLRKINFEQYDIISSRENVISGHFTLYRNSPTLNLLYQKVPNYEKIFTTDEHLGFDEGAFSYHLFRAVETGEINFQVFWEGRNCIDRGELQRMPKGWHWTNGKVRNFWGREGTYLHLIDWKRTLLTARLTDPASSKYFKINRLGIWESRIPIKFYVKLLWNHGWHDQFLFFKGQLIEFIKYKLLRKEKRRKPNVLPQYRTL